jgi:putative glycosyltransferase (TIGR04372 family)
VKVKPILKSFALIFAFVVLCLFKLFSPIIRVKAVLIGAHKFGHLALEPDLMLQHIKYLMDSSRRKWPKIFVLWSMGPKKSVSNKTLVKLWKRRLFIVPSWMIDACSRCGKKFPSLSIDFEKTSIFGPSNHQLVTQPPVSFSKHEISASIRSLTKMGIDLQRPFVCLVVRDSGHYSDSTGIENPAYEFRNHDIEAFYDAIRTMITHGYQVVRLGAGKEKPISIRLEGLFDYATSPFRCELLDLFLASNCSFAVSTQTGPDAVCLLFRRPVCFIDVPHIGGFFLGSGLCTWNPLLYQKDLKTLSLNEMVLSNLIWEDSPVIADNNGFSASRSSPSEINDYVRAYIELFEAGFKLGDRETALVAKANLALSQGLGERGILRFGDYEACLNPVFLNKHGDWFIS